MKVVYYFYAVMAELVDALVSDASEETHGSSSLLDRTNAPVAQLNRAQPPEGWSHVFESHRALQKER